VLGQDAVVRVRIPGRVRRCPADGVIHGQVLTLRRDPILPQRDPALVLQDVPVNGCGSLPAIEPTATHTITITEQGFVPAQLQAAPGSVVAWVNATQDWRSVTSNGWESGLLISGDSAQLHVSSAGTLLFRAGDHTATLVVREATQASKVFLPVVSR
jgi:plastocyanin